MRRWTLLLAALLFLSACSGQKGEHCLIYYRTAGDNTAAGALSGEAYEMSRDPEAIPTALELLLSAPDNVTLRSPFPTGTKLNGWVLEKGRLTVDFSEQYGKLYGIDYTDCGNKQIIAMFANYISMNSPKYSATCAERFSEMKRMAEG